MSKVVGGKVNMLRNRSRCFYKFFKIQRKTEKQADEMDKMQKEGEGLLYIYIYKYIYIYR